MVGQVASAVPGADPALSDKLWAAADSGGGWVPYTMLNIVNGTAMDKESYVLPLGDGTLVGCGIYRGDGVQVAAKPRSVAWSRREEKTRQHVTA